MASSKSGATKGSAIREQGFIFGSEGVVLPELVWDDEDSLNKEDCEKSIAIMIMAMSEISIILLFLTFILQNVDLDI